MWAYLRKTRLIDIWICTLKPRSYRSASGFCKTARFRTHKYLFVCCSYKSDRRSRSTSIRVRVWLRSYFFLWFHHQLHLTKLPDNFLPHFAPSDLKGIFQLFYWAWISNASSAEFLLVEKTDRMQFPVGPKKICQKGSNPIQRTAYLLLNLIY